MKSGFSDQELAEMRAFDEMIDRLDVVEADWASRWIDDLAKLDRMEPLRCKEFERRRKYRKANKDRIAEYQREYYAANKDRIAEQKREYRAERKRRKQDETDGR